MKKTYKNDTSVITRISVRCQMVLPCHAVSYEHDSRQFTLLFTAMLTFKGQTPGM